jgi:hypothetical protein
MSPPVTAIIAYDMRSYGRLKKLAPYNPKARSIFEDSPDLADVTAKFSIFLYDPGSLL